MAGEAFRELRKGSAMENRATIGWLGVGKMGQPMVRRLLAANYHVVVYDRDPANGRTVIGDGARLATSPQDLLQGADVIMSMIPNDQVLDELVSGESGLAGKLRPEQIFVELSTVSPKISSKVARELMTPRYLRAPVSGSTQTAENGSLTVVVSGPKEDFDICQPILEAFSSRQYYVGQKEEARFLKLVLNSLVAANASLMADALRLGHAGGLSRSTMMEIICESAVTSPLLKYKRDNIVGNDYPPAFSVSQMVKDTGLIAQAAADAGINMAINAICLDRLRHAASCGLDEQDFFVLTSEDFSLET